MNLWRNMEHFWYRLRRGGILCFKIRFIASWYTEKSMTFMTLNGPTNYYRKLWPSKKFRKVGADRSQWRIEGGADWVTAMGPQHLRGSQSLSPKKSVICKQ